MTVDRPIKLKKSLNRSLWISSIPENRVMVEPIYYLVDGALTLWEELNLLITSLIFGIDPGTVKNSAWIMMPTGPWEGRKYTNHIFHFSLLM